jgi:hypothetical protein
VEHPIHIHLAPFQVIFIGGSDLGPYNQGWKDTVNLNNGAYATPLVPFDGYRGRCVFHPPQPGTRGHADDGQLPGHLTRCALVDDSDAGDPPAASSRMAAPRRGGVDYGIVAVCLVLLGLAGVLGRTAGLLPAHINISLRRGLGRPRRPPRGGGCRWR